MKKKLLAILLVIIISECFSILFVLKALDYLSRSSETLSYDMDRPAARTTGSTVYSVEADVSVSENILHVRETLNLPSPVKRMLFYVPSANNAATQIISVSAGEPVSYRVRQETNLEIDGRKKEDRFTVEYSVKLENRGQILAYTGDSYLLTNFLIVPAVYKNGKPIFTFKNPFGDPYIYNTASYRVTFRFPSGYAVFAPGVREDHPSGKLSVVTFKADNLRDFPAVLMKAPKVRTEQKGSVEICYVNAGDAREDINRALDFARDHIGPYPYTQLFVVRAPISLKGMEFSNMVFLSDSCFTSPDLLKRIAYHEVFHQWFYGIIGTDQVDEPFLDEGLVNFLSMQLAGDRLDTRYDRQLFNTRLNEYASRDEYYRMAYTDASRYFQSLYGHMGNRLFRMLEEVYTERKYTILDYDDFAKYVDKYTGGS